MDIICVFFFVFASCAFLTSSILKYDRQHDDKNFDYMCPDMVETHKESGDDPIPNSENPNPEFYENDRSRRARP